MLTEQEVRQVIGRDVYGSDGEKIGQVGQVFLSDQTNEPEFATVNTGLFGMNENFVPLTEASLSDGSLTVPFSKDTVKDAPTVRPDAGHLSEEDEAELFSYYGIPYDGAAGRHGDGDRFADGRSGRSGRSGRAAMGDMTTDATAEGRYGAGHDTSGPNTDDAMTRSEERLDVGIRSEETGRARLRKYVETEHVETTVPVSRERAVVETEPITPENRDEALSGPEISEEEHEVILHTETPVVGKHAEPVERVRLAKQAETHEEPVPADLRKERIDLEGDIDNR